MRNLIETKRIETFIFTLFPAQLTADLQKIPLIKGWQDLATTDPTQLQAWGAEFGERLRFWGIPTGIKNDILVLDIDVKNGKNGFESLQKYGFELPDTLVQRTLNGGSHYIFKYPKDGRHHGNKTGLLEKESGLDVRGEGGWIAFYGQNMDWSKKIADAPAWLIQDHVKPSQTAQAASIAVAPAIAEGILASSLEAIREAPSGESNNTLNVEAFKVGQLVASGAITREFAHQELFKAAKDRGKPDYEANETIKSGLDGGTKKPLTSPFGVSSPVLAFTLPSPPDAPASWTPRALTREDLMNTAMLKKPQLFQDWSTADIHLTTANGGTGKTTLKLYEAICLALGERFLGFNCLRPGGKTLFITGEDTAGKLAAMIGAITRQMGLFDGTPENNKKIETILSCILIKKDSDLCLISKDRQGFLHPSTDAMIKVSQAVDEFKPDMIVFDPIASFWGSEAALNDMNKAVTKFMAELVDRAAACVDMINHMGKQSSANRDMSQFAGRGGTGLVSNSRVSRVMHPLPEAEYSEMTGGDVLGENQSAIYCVVNKFSDGSPLFEKPFIIVRTGHIFHRKQLTPKQAEEIEKSFSDIERVLAFVSESRRENKYPTKTIIQGHFMMTGNKISQARTKVAMDMLQFAGHGGQMLKLIDNPDQTQREKAFIIVDLDGIEVLNV